MRRSPRGPPQSLVEARARPEVASLGRRSSFRPAAAEGLPLWSACLVGAARWARWSWPRPPSPAPRRGQLVRPLPSLWLSRAPRRPGLRSRVPRCPLSGCSPTFCTRLRCLAYELDRRTAQQLGMPDPRVWPIGERSSAVLAGDWPPGPPPLELSRWRSPSRPRAVSLLCGLCDAVQCGRPLQRLCCGFGPPRFTHGRRAHHLCEETVSLFALVAARPGPLAARAPREVVSLLRDFRILFHGLLFVASSGTPFLDFSSLLISRFSLSFHFRLPSVRQS